jgi:ubiquinone/menaquinone biosynthesis C-methylase UbiE
MAERTGTAREDRDIMRLAPTVDAGMLQTLANRLEFRGTDAEYERLSMAYVARLPLASARRILALGCGTGIEVRALKRVSETTAAIIGIDHSPYLIDIARQRTAAEGLDAGVEYVVGDAHHLQLEEAAFDIVLLHTLISHVDDPEQVLREACRVVRPGGMLAIFDGDYASLNFAYPDAVVAKEIEELLLTLLFANPRVMRDLPRLLRAVGLELVEASGAIYANIGTGRFWANAVESYAAFLARSGLLPEAAIEGWRSYQAQAIQEHTFFASCTYYTYLARRAT